MKRLLLPLLAALALPTAVNAETWYLLGKGSKGATWQVPMESKEECEKQGQKFIKEWDWKGKKGIMLGYMCIKGK